MSITLYGLGTSRSFRCLWALEETGLEYQFRSLDLGGTDEHGAKSESYLTLNSQGKVPTLTHNDFVLTESAAILNYISTVSESENNNGFIPSQIQERARYDELAFFILSELEQPLWSNGKHRFAIPEEHRVPDMLKTATWEFEKALNALSKLTGLSDTNGSKSDFVLPNGFSFADILLAQTLDWADRFKFEVPSAYLTYRDSMYTRPAAIQALQALN